MPAELGIEFLEPQLDAVGGQHEHLAGHALVKALHEAEQVQRHALGKLLPAGQPAALALQHLRCNSAPPAHTSYHLGAIFHKPGDCNRAHQWTTPRASTDTPSCMVPGASAAGAPFTSGQESGMTSLG